MKDKTLHMTMLFDFFGDLLTEKQREYFDLYHNEDLSLSEIAEKAGISRQGVYDIILRAENALARIEHKTGVIARFDEMRSELETAVDIAKQIQGLAYDTESASLAEKLVVILEKLKGADITAG